MNQVAKWRRWSISKEWNIATKTARSYHTKGAILKEVMILETLNKAWITRVPQVIERVEWWFKYYWIEWIHFDKIYNRAEHSIQRTLATQLLDHAYELDRLWIVHGELQRPTGNILVNSNNEISIIDFERWWILDYSWRNMKAVGQWLRREWYLEVTVLRELSGKSLEDIYKKLIGYIRNTEVSNTNTSSGIYWELFFSLLILLIVDLGSKYLFYTLEFGAATQFLEPVLNLGSARSLPIPHWITWLWALAVSVWICYEYREKNIWLLASSLVVAGAIGNSIDRIVYGGVRDFIDITSIISYPIFNLADTFLVVWVCIIIYTSFMSSWD